MKILLHLGKEKIRRLNMYRGTLLLLFLFSTLSASAQVSAVQTMRVTARVTRSVGAEILESHKPISLKRSMTTKLGVIKLDNEDSQSVLVFTAEQVKLRSPAGITFSLNLKRKLENNRRVILYGNVAGQKSNNRLKSTFYTGKVETTIQYM